MKNIIILSIFSFFLSLNSYAGEGSSGGGPKLMMNTFQAPNYLDLSIKRSREGGGGGGGTWPKSTIKNSITEEGGTSGGGGIPKIMMNSFKAPSSFNLVIEKSKAKVKFGKAQKHSAIYNLASFNKTSGDFRSGTWAPVRHKNISIKSDDFVNAQLFNGKIITKNDLMHLSNVTKKANQIQIGLKNNQIIDLNLKSQGIIDIRDFAQQKDDGLKDCYDACKDEYSTGSKELKSCIFGCIYPEDQE